MRRATAVLAALALVGLLAGCAGNTTPQLSGPAAGQHDINPMPPERVRDGGDLRWPLDSLPVNFNYNHLDGPDGQTTEVVRAVLPYMFTGNADGTLTSDPHFVTAVELVSTAPQTIRYTIHPMATWSDGTPITWRDFAAQAAALSGRDAAFITTSRTGYEHIATVRRGADDKQVLVEFARPYAEWKVLFRPLYPASTNSDPAVFNTGWRGKMPVTAGPFRLEGIDPTAKTITLVRDERWWGTRPKLDRILFKVLERTARADALANNEIDYYVIGSSVDLFRRAQGTPGVAIRQAADRRYNHLTFNGAPGAIFADPALRQAVAKGVDRMGIARRLVGPIVGEPVLMGNHLYPAGSSDYRDNSAGHGFDAEAARRELEAMGWRLQGTGPEAVRVRDGKPLEVRYVQASGNPISDQISRLVLEQLAAIGVSVKIETVPSAEFFERHVRVGNFDLTGFVWVQTPTPFSSSAGLYAPPNGSDVQQNYGRISDPEIVSLFAAGVGELDDAKRAELGNRIDALIWKQVHHLPLYPNTGAYAVRSSLANFGAPGYADIDYVGAGFAQ